LEDKKLIFNQNEIFGADQSNTNNENSQVQANSGNN